MLTREQILGADDLATKQIDVPQWGGSVTIRAMTAADRDRLERKITAMGDSIDTTGMRVAMAILTVVDENGELMFSDDDAEALASKSSAAIETIFSESAAFNGFDFGAVEKN